MTEVYLRDVSRCAIRLDRKQEAALCRRAQRGDLAARDMLIYSQLPWAVKCAKRYANGRLLLDDLIQVSNLAVISAIGKMNPKRGRLTTLVALVIRQEVSLFVLRTLYPVRVAANTHGTAHLEAAANRARLDTVSIGEASDDSGPFDLIDPRENDYPEAECNEERLLLFAAIEKLPPNEREVIELRLRGLTFKEIADRRGVVKQRAQQIERVAKRHLRKLIQEAA